jgi:hypothetical protein
MITAEVKVAASLFTGMVFKHEGRSSNGESYRLARSTVSLDAGRQVWFIQPPDGLSIPVTCPNINE